MIFFFQIIHFLLLSAVWIFGFLESFTIEKIGKLVKKMPQTIVQLFSWTQAFNFGLFHISKSIHLVIFKV